MSQRDVEARIREALLKQRPELEAVSKTADADTREEIKSLKSEQQIAKLDRYRAWTKGLKRDIKARKRYARLTFRLICWWVSGLFLLLLLTGFLSEGTKYNLWNGESAQIKFTLPPSVLLMLLGTSTATVIGLFAVVMYYIFPSKRPYLDAGAPHPDHPELDDEK